jgi:hypothetical protein
MYYSYVEIEYVATSFSPARTDLALKLLTERTINQSASNKATASTLDPTKPTDVSNVNVPQKKKQKKNAIISTLGTHRNPKRKKDLDKDPDDRNVPHPPAVETNVPTYVCNWAQAIVCEFPQLEEPLKCQHTDCEFLVHHLCQSAWEQRGGHPDTVSRYCCLHHPQYKYQHVFDRSGVSKKSSSSNKGKELSVDLDATIAEQTINVSDSVLDGKNDQFIDVSASATSSMQDMTVSHFNASRQNVDG